MKINGKDYITRREFSERTGVSLRNLQYYEDPLGLICPRRIERGDGGKDKSVRVYTGHDIVRMRMIKMYIDLLGITATDVSEIFKTLDLNDDNAIASDLRARLEEQKRRIQDNLEIIDYLEHAGSVWTTSIYNASGRDAILGVMSKCATQQEIYATPTEDQQNAVSNAIAMCIAAINKPGTPRDEIAFNNGKYTPIRSEQLDAAITALVESLKDILELNSLATKLVILSVLAMYKKEKTIIDDYNDVFKQFDWEALTKAIYISIIDTIERYYKNQIFPDLCDLSRVDREEYLSELIDRIAVYAESHMAVMWEYLLDAMAEMMNEDSREATISRIKEYAAKLMDEIIETSITPDEIFEINGVFDLYNVVLGVDDKTSFHFRHVRLK